MKWYFMKSRILSMSPNIVHKNTADDLKLQQQKKTTKNKSKKRVEESKDKTRNKVVGNIDIGLDRLSFS